MHQENKNSVIEKKYLKFNEDEKKELIKFFGSKVLFNSKSEMAFLKYNISGFKIIHSALDKRYYVFKINFQEPIDLRNPVSFNMWTGANILKKYASSVSEIINIIENDILFSRLPAVKNYLFLKDYDKNNRVIILSENKKYLSFNEYDSFHKWYTKNYIWLITLNEKELEQQKNRRIKLKYGKKIREMFTKIDDNDNSLNLSEKKYLVCFIG